MIKISNFADSVPVKLRATDFTKFKGIMCM